MLAAINSVAQVGVAAILDEADVADDGDGGVHGVQVISLCYS